jgi:hypothetical protein
MRNRPLSERLAAFQQRFVQQFHDRRRQQQLSRLRQQRQRTISPASDQWLNALRRSLQFRWFQRRLQRSRLNQQPSGNSAAWFWPRAALGLSTRDAAAGVLRSGAAALMLLLLTSLVLSAVPLRLTTPNWYLEVLALVGESIPLIVLACAFALLSLALNSDEQLNAAYLGKLLRISRLGYILALLLLPLQLGFFAWLFGDAFNTNRIQQNAVRSNADALINGALQSTTSAQFVAYLQSRNLNINLESIAAAPLAQVRTEFIRSVKTQQQQQLQSLAATTRTNLLRYAVNSLRLFTALAILAAFLRGFRSMLRRSSLQGLATNQPLEQERHQPLEIQTGQLDSAINSDTI